MRVLLCAVVLLASACSIPAAKPGTVGPGSSDTPTAAGAVKTATWGERYTWPDGLAVEVSAPVACKPGKYAMPDGIQRAVKVTIKVVNGSPKEFNAGVLGIGSDAQFAGKTAETVFDSSGTCGGGMDSGTVLPGKTFELAQAFAVGKESGELQITLQPQIMAAKAIFVGPA